MVSMRELVRFGEYTEVVVEQTQSVVAPMDRVPNQDWK